MMTDTLVGVSPPTPEPAEPAESDSSGGSERELSPAELAVIEGLVPGPRRRGCVDRSSRAAQGDH